MRCMVLHRPHEPLQLVERPTPRPGPGQLLIRVHACGVCRTDLHVVDGELTQGALPIVPGHEIVGTVIDAGADAQHAVGERVGVPWLAGACGDCEYCRTGRENLCDRALFTGYHVDGGYADHVIARDDCSFAIPARYSDAEAAPLLCAGLIGHRSLRMTGEARRVGLYGFGAAAHVIAQVAVQEGREICAFTRPEDTAARALALRLGATWAGASTEMPPEPLDAAILFAPVGSLVPAALAAVRKGGVVVCAGIHMSDIPSFPYSLLWGERALRSVANLTRADGREFMALAARLRIETTVETFPLEQANEALSRLRSGRVTGAAVLDCRGRA
jgi:propanol-preferring alcohol dehydrogenase